MDNKDYFENRPVTMNPKNNLLEIEEHMYALQDVEKPNAFRNMFPYDEIPKIPFNDRVVPHNMPKDIWITDTTFRDGQQSRAPYTTEQIVTIYDYLKRTEMQYINVWKEVISSRKLLPGFVQAKKISSL